MNLKEMTNEAVWMMTHNMRQELEWRPRWVMRQIGAPVTDAHITRLKRALDRLERRYS